MGTHPIFESDFDCLTDYRQLYLWRRSVIKLQTERIQMRFTAVALTLIALSCANDTIIDMTPGGMPSPPTKRIGDLSHLIGEEEWEMILNAMVWTEGPAWWNKKLVFSDTRLGKIFSWDPITKLVGVVVELAGNDSGNTGVWMEPFSNGLKFNPTNDELLICEHGNRGIAALQQNGDIKKLTYRDVNGNPFNSPNDVAVHKSGDFYFTDPIFGKMTLNANILRGNMHEMPELDTPGYSGVYHYNAKTKTSTLIEKNMVVPNGIAISGDRLVVSYCNQTRWEWWEWDIKDDGSLSDSRILANLSGKLTGQGFPDGLDIDEEGNVWTSAPGGLIIIDTNGNVVGQEKFLTIAVSNVLLAPDGYVYLTGNHGVYRKKRVHLNRDEL